MGKVRDREEDARVSWGQVSWQINVILQTLICTWGKEKEYKFIVPTFSLAQELPCWGERVSPLKSSELGPRAEFLFFMKQLPTYTENYSPAGFLAFEAFSKQSII